MSPKRPMSYLCTANCPFVTMYVDNYLEHLVTCDKIAPWVSAWAKRVSQRPDWKKVVGLV